MSTSGAQHKLEEVREPPIANLLDEAVWQAWVLKGRAREERKCATRIVAVKWISLAGLLLAVATGLWSQLTPFDVGARFLVAAGAMLLMLNAFRTRDYAAGSVFGALALLYNPAAPVFSFSGEWQRALVAGTAVPFVVSLTWRGGKLVPNE